ncbi:MAG: DUF3343 domain-containing protein [Clostridia bacterium]|nr:DUF3343 domain-containing protein [Clostridia bacterium]
MICIATFYSHFGAIRFKRACDRQGWPAAVMPVPRDLSSSCGTCVRYEGDCPPQPPQEVEQIVACENGGYRPLYRAENS